MVGDFGGDTKYLTFEGGYEQLLIGLARSIECGGGNIWLSNRLEGFVKSPKK